MKNKRTVSFSKQPIPDQLHNARLLIENTQDSPAILAIMLNFGYTAADFTAAHTIYRTALAASKAASTAGGNAELATADFEKEMEKVRGRYADFAKIARSIFRGNKAALSALGVDKRRPKAIAAFMNLAEKFYDFTELTPEVVEKLKKRCNDSWLSQARGEVAQLKLARKHQVELSGDAEDATAAQTTALKALVEWCVEYIAVSRVALKKSPQTLEKLGIKVRNGKTRAQIEGARKSAATRKLNRAKQAGLSEAA